MEINLFEETVARSEMTRLGGVWIELLNQHCDGVVYIKPKGPEEEILLGQIK